MLDLCKQREVALLIPTRDEELPLFAEHKDRFAQIGTTVAVSPPESVRVCQDKRLFANVCLQNALPIPLTYAAGTLPPEDAYPVFVKPRVGKGGRGIRKIDSAAELRELLSECPDLLVQECVSDPEYTIDTFVDFTGKVISVVPRERTFVLAGESYVSRTRKAPRLMDEAIRLVTKLNLLGHITIQCFYNEDRVRFIEVNPRFGGAANLGFAAGALTPRFLIRSLQGKPVEPVIGEFRDNYVMLRYTQDIFMEGERLKHT